MSTRHRRAAFVAVLLVMAIVFVALGIWQVERRTWKHALIAAVDARTHAPPGAAPGPMIPISASGDAYRTVTVTGHFLSNRRTLVRAVSDAGAGYWVLTPLDTGRFVVLVNRGFILPERKDMLSDPVGPVHITGLLRITEPGGGFLRANDPVADRWFSRDVGAIVTRRRIANAAPYFIDADAASTITGGPQGGLTVIRFPDNHLAYAITWFGMALLCLWALWRLGTSP